MRIAYAADPAVTGTTAAKPDNRSSPRVQTTFRIARVLTGAHVGLARLRDISDGGVGLELYMPVLLGDALTVQLGGNLAVRGRVVWTCGSNCGIKLDAAIDSDLLLAALAQQGCRAIAEPVRLAIAKTAAAREADGTGQVERVDVRQDGGLTEGLTVRIELPDRTNAHGTVRWSGDGLAGLMLLDPSSAEQPGSVRNL